ncbi:Putative ribonuclease H protein At1g65750 [Linum perenne]
MMNSFWWGMKSGARRGLSWMRWERLCIRKEHGGMGFRDMHGFNLAMLGKARYFPRGDFLSAPQVKGPSVIWQSIHSFFIDTPRIDELGGLHVCDLLIPGLREWDTEMIQSLFSARDAALILGIPIPTAPIPDQIIWHFGKKGLFTVRSCYRLIMETIAPRDHLHTPGPWTELWNIQTPPRLRCFAWRVARGVLPTRMALEGRHLAVPSECGICSQDLEHAWHLFLQCPFAQRCWNEAGLLQQVTSGMQNADSMQEWLFNLVKTGDDDRVARSIAIMGAIWRERNNRVWNAESNEPLAVVREGLEGLKNWTTARSTPVTDVPPPNHCERWHPPPTGQVKCNVDAALFFEEGRHGMGALIRSNDGRLFQYRMSASDGCPTAEECEALALIDAITWLSSLGLTNVTIELDCLNVVQAINSAADDQSEFGTLCDLARRSMHPSWSLQYARRNGNLAAHTLARHSRYLTSPVVGDASPPWLVNALTMYCTTCNL